MTPEREPGLLADVARQYAITNMMRHAILRKVERRAQAIAAEEAEADLGPLDQLTLMGMAASLVFDELDQRGMTILDPNRIHGVIAWEP
jgi:hypothetical protein